MIEIIIFTALFAVHPLLGVAAIIIWPTLIAIYEIRKELRRL